MISAVATAEPARRGGCRRVPGSNAAGAPRRSEAATTFTMRILRNFMEVWIGLKMACRWWPRL